MKWKDLSQKRDMQRSCEQGNEFVGSIKILMI